MSEKINFSVFVRNFVGHLPRENHREMIRKYPKLDYTIDGNVSKI